MSKKIILIVFLGLVAFGTVCLYRSIERELIVESTAFPGGDSRIQVVATFYPLREMARLVVGELGEVTSIVPAGTEPHEFEPTPGAIKLLYEADLVLINGAGMDPWAEKLVPDLMNKGVAVKILANEVELLRAEEHGHEGEMNKEEHERDGYDPHFWLDPVVMSQLVKGVGTILIEHFPSKQEMLTKNTAEAAMEFEALDKEYQTGLASCQKKEVVTSHNAFAYLAKRYQFEVHSLTGISPEEEPSPRELTTLAEEVRKEDIRYIFFETLVSPKLSETLAREVGATTLVFNPIEGVTEEERARGENYFSLMRSNLKSLQMALECE